MVHPRLASQLKGIWLCLQICWKWTKVVTDAPQRNGSGFRAFLDGSQYKLTGILRYERIFGPGFVSTGGIDTTKARQPAQTCCYPILFSIPALCHKSLNQFVHMHALGHRTRDCSQPSVQPVEAGLASCLVQKWICCAGVCGDDGPEA